MSKFNFSHFTPQVKLLLEEKIRIEKCDGKGNQKNSRFRRTLNCT